MSMKLGMCILSEVLNQTIPISLAQPKKRLTEIFQSTNGLTLKVDVSLIPLDNGLIFAGDKVTRNPLFVSWSVHHTLLLSVRTAITAPAQPPLTVLPCIQPCLSQK